jgi:hypothetical protein
MSKPKFRHVATIRKREFRVLGLAPLSERVVVTARIRAKLAGYGISLALARRVIEHWDYQRRAPTEKDAHSTERYTQLEGVWYIAVIYVPMRGEEIEFNQVATCHRFDKRKLDALLAEGALRSRKKEDRA